MAVRIIVEQCQGLLCRTGSWSTPCGLRSRGGSRTTSPCRSLTCTSRFIPLWWATTDKPFEIQIRTYEMHKIAEYGIAAHWKYKEGITTDKEEVNLSWLRQALEWQKDANDPKEFMESLKMDLFSSQVFVFTPNGRRDRTAGRCDTAGLRIQDPLGRRL